MSLPVPTPALRTCCCLVRDVHEGLRNPSQPKLGLCPPSKVCHVGHLAPASIMSIMRNNVNGVIIEGCGFRLPLCFRGVDVCAAGSPRAAPLPIPVLFLRVVACDETVGCLGCFPEVAWHCACCLLSTWILLFAWHWNAGLWTSISGRISV